MLPLNLSCLSKEYQAFGVSTLSTLGNSYAFSLRKINLVIAVALFSVGIFGLLMARASTLSVAGPSLSKLTH